MKMKKVRLFLFAMKHSFLSGWFETQSKRPNACPDDRRKARAHEILADMAAKAIIPKASAPTSPPPPKSKR